MTGGDLHRPDGSLSDGRWSVHLDQERAGWAWTSLRVLVLGPGESQEVRTGGQEMLVLPLAGSCAVSCGGQRLDLAGRESVFDGLTDFAYLPRNASAEIFAPAGGRFALPGALAGRDLPFRYAAAAGTTIELRGAGSCSRQVNNFCTEAAFEADKLLACEVITPAGNWSSYPPHKHDEERPGESELEEIYYFEFADPVSAGQGPEAWAEPDTGIGPGPGMGYQRVYGSPGRPVDVLAEVRSGDVVLIPHGWHGPSMAVPGYHMYYLGRAALADLRRSSARVGP
jgi:5-deoxy-glucuronate isomerase